MADVTNRDAKEALISKPLSKEFSRFRIQLLSIIPGMDPWMMDIAPEFWVEHQAGLTAAISPAISGIYIAQAETFLDDVDFLGVDWGLANEGAITFAKDYTFSLVTDLVETSRKTLRRVIPAFFEDGWTQGQLSDSLSSTFGTMRASMIARTEVTRAASEGEQGIARLLSSQGITMTPVWQTRNDELVCPICGPKASKPIKDGSYPPAHPRCRCWVTHEIIS